MEILTLEVPSEEKGIEIMNQIEKNVIAILEGVGIDTLTEQEKEDCEHDLDAMKEAAEEKFAETFPRPVSPPEAYELGDNLFSVMYQVDGDRIYLSLLSI